MRKSKIVSDPLSLASMEAFSVPEKNTHTILSISCSSELEHVRCSSQVMSLHIRRGRKLEGRSARGEGFGFRKDFRG